MIVTSHPKGRRASGPGGDVRRDADRRDRADGPGGGDEVWGS